MELDPQVKALASAIKKQESGGSKDPYNSKGASGEHGAYQFMPDTWKSWAGTHLGDANAPMTMENQNKVAYNQIKSWKDKGYNPAQIAAAWNAGEGSLKNDSWKTLKGVNKLGVAYDTPSYVSNVSKYYQELKGVTPEASKNTNLTPEGIDLSSIPTVTKEQEPSIIGDIVRGAVKAPLGFVSQARDIGGDLAQIPGILRGEAYTPNLGQTEYDYGGLGKVKSFGAATPDTQGFMSMVRAAGAGTDVASNLLVPEVKGLAGIGKATIGQYANPISKTIAKATGMSSLGTALQDAETPSDIIPAIGSGALGYVGGRGIGLIPGVAAGAYNAKYGFSPKLFTELDNAVKAGDDDAVKAITSTPEYQSAIKTNKYDEKALQDSIKTVREDINTGIDNSTGVSKLTRSERAEAITDDGITAMLEHSVNSKNPIFDTKLSLENKANELMDDALNPILDKVRTEKLPLANLDRAGLIDDFNTRLDKTYLADKDKESIKAYVKDLIETQNKGDMFGVVDAGIIRRNANFDFVNPKNKGVVGRILGNTMRDALGLAEKNTTDPAAKAIIAHINAVNKEYSRLMQGVDVVDLMARFPGQKSSELLNKAAGFMAAGSTGNNPLAYLGAHKVVNAAQRAMIRSKTGKIFGDITAKAGPLTSSELIGNAKRILGNVEGISAGKKAAEQAVIDTTTNAAKKEAAVSKLLETISPKRDADLPVIEMGPTAKSKYNKPDKSLKTIRGMAKPELLATLGGLGMTAVGAYNKMQEDTKYQREPDVKEEPFMKPVVNENTPDINVIADRIAYAETRGEETPYSTSKWSNRTLGPASPLGKDLGKYQITSARLREKSKEFLGKQVSDSEFLKSPELQDKFIREQIKWQLANGMTEDEIYATHRRGWGNLKPEQIKKAVATSSDYINAAKSK